MRSSRLSLAVIAPVLVTVLVGAQGRGGGSEWQATYGDPQRTSWIRTDAAISIESMSKPGFELQWKTKLENAPRQGNGLMQGVTVNGVMLFTPLSVVTGSSNNVFALDNDTGYTFWQRHFDAALPAATAACPGGITASAARTANLTPPAAGGGRGFGGGGGGRGGYSSVLGDAGEGAPVQMRGGGARANAPAAPGAAPGAPGAAGGRGPGGGGGGGGGFGRGSGSGYVVSSDGMVRTLGFAMGKEIQKPAAFVPAGARVSDPIVINNVLYATVSGNCGGSSDGVYVMDLSSDSRTVTSWKTNGGSPIGPLAFATDGTPIVAIGPGKAASGGYANAIVALDPKTLQPKDWFTQPGVEIASGPLVFTHNDKDVVAVATKDGRILLLDAKSPGGANHATPLYTSRSVAAAGPEALGMWQEITTIPAPPAAPDAAPGTPPPAPTTKAGLRWLLVPVAGRMPADLQVPTTNGAVTNGAILALKVVDEGGRLALQPDWVSRDLTAPITPVAVNGVVFAASGGKSPAVLYAINGRTGKEIWSSGKTITAPLSGRSFWSGAGQVYVGTSDATVYAFGFAMERK